MEARAVKVNEVDEKHFERLVSLDTRVKLLSDWTTRHEDNDNARFKDLETEMKSLRADMNNGFEVLAGKLSGLERKVAYICGGIGLATVLAQLGAKVFLGG